MIATPVENQHISRRAIFILWLASGVALLINLGGSPLVRTQEARVLETARQMVQPENSTRTAPQRWFVPTLNGRYRLRKPPLAYWMTAAAYEIGGVSTAAGRAPTAIAGWLTIGVTFLCASHRFGRRAAAISCACLLSSYLFFRHSRLAETDAPAMLGVTIAIWAWWRGIDESVPNGRRPKFWFLLGGLGVVIAILAKGGPAAFPGVFLFAWIVINRRWRAVREFILSGTPVLILVLGASWFYYIFHSVEVEQLSDEVDTLVGGDDHPGTVVQYFVDLLLATAPWFLLLPAAAVETARGWRDSRRLGLIVWVGSIFVPLCAIKNKQVHYLLPLMPPLAMMIGFWIDQAIFSVEKDRSGWTGFLRDASLAMFALLPVVVLVGSHRVNRHFRPVDLTLAGLLGGLAIVALIAFIRVGRRGAFAALLAGSLLIAPAAWGVWLPSMERDDSVELATDLRKNFGAGPYCFWGRNLSLSLCFRLREPIPQIVDYSELKQLSDARPHLTVIVKQGGRFKPAPLPAEYKPKLHLQCGQQQYDVYQK